MATPVWVTDSNLGISAQYVSCSKKLIATGATSFTLISGNLPNGVTLSTDGIISGIPQILNIQANKLYYEYLFTIRANNNNGSTNKTFKLCVFSDNLYVPKNFNMSQLRFGSNFLQYQIVNGVSGQSNLSWKLENSNLPPGTTIRPEGIIEIVSNSGILPFRRNQFIRPDVDPDTVSSLSQSSWDSWLSLYLLSPRDRDYQFTINLSDASDLVQLSLTVRMLIIKDFINLPWFQTNAEYLNVDTSYEYIFFAISESDSIIWETDSNLGSVANGSISELKVVASCNSGKEIVYNIKPTYNSKLPQQLTLANNGLILGRISFRCYQDDPISVPVNDDYSFTVRASAADKFTYSEKTFNLHVERLYNGPYNNLWIRAFPQNEKRIQFEKFITDPTFFPDRLLYRPTDKYFGKIKFLRFLFASGLAPASTADYYENLLSNHYNKVVLFDEVKTAVAYDQNLNVIYEVVYVPIVDFSQIANFETNTIIGQSNVIDLREKIKNFFYKDGQIYYEFEPNGLTNMLSTIKNFGYGLLPNWMTSIQPIPGQIGQFRSPLGFVPCVALAYTIPGASDAIAFRLKQAGFNFNLFKFEFDRYELDDFLSLNYDIENKTFLPSGTETIFDNGSTVFEQTETKFNENLDFSTIFKDRDPNFGTKYLKFPKTGIFV